LNRRSSTSHSRGPEAIIQPKGGDLRRNCSAFEPFLLLVIQTRSISHDQDQTSDCRTGGRGDGGLTYRCQCDVPQAYEASQRGDYVRKHEARYDGWRQHEVRYEVRSPPETRHDDRRQYEVRHEQVAPMSAAICGIKANESPRM